MDLKNLWVDKYPEKTLESYICEDAVKESIQNFLDGEGMMNLVLSGPAGTGKSLLARIILRELRADFLFMNSSDERKLETVREKIKKFCSVPSLKKIPKVVVMDEGEALLFDSQNALKGVMDLAVNTRFIITTNTPSLIIDPIMSRCKHIVLNSMDLQKACTFILKILQKEGVKFSDPEMKFVLRVCKNFYPDLRKSINFIQFHTSNGVIDLSANVEESDIFGKLISLLKNKNLPELRTFCLSNHFSNTTEILKYLFKNTDKFVKNDNGSSEIIIAEHLYREAFVADKEINLATCLLKLMQNK